MIRTISPLLRMSCLALAGLLTLSACSSKDDSVGVAERVEAGPLVISVQGQGELRSTKATPLAVPGQQFSSRQLVWVLPDGSRVKKSDVVARFSAKQSKQDLAEAMVDLERNALARAGKQSDIESQRGKLDVDMAQVDIQLGIAKRFASASLVALARNQILDSVEDEHFLTTKQGILDWRLQQSGARGTAELAVIDAKRATFALQAKQKRDDLAALEIRAPHDGVLVLQADWSGVKPHVGTNMWAGSNFASLPDTSKMEVQLWVPQLEAQGLKVGDAVELHPLGEPAQTTTSRLSWIAPAALPRSRESPVKYISMKAQIPAAAAKRYSWVPGQRFAARVMVLDAKSALSVPNLAIVNGAHGPMVRLLEGDKIVKRAVTLGIRGATRSQVTKGLEAGDEVLLNLGGKDAGS